MRYFMLHMFRMRRLAFIKEMINFFHYIVNGFLVAIALLKANAVAFKPPSSELFGYRQTA